MQLITNKTFNLDSLYQGGAANKDLLCTKAATKSAIIAAQRAQRRDFFFFITAAISHRCVVNQANQGEIWRRWCETATHLLDRGTEPLCTEHHIENTFRLRKKTQL